MEFSDLSFLLLFLPLFIGTYYITKKSNIVILLFSVLFYLLSDVKYLLLLLIVIAVTYLAGIKVKNNKTVYVIYIVFTIGLLLFFKYINLVLGMFADETDIVRFVLPVGISYYLFESFSYVSDCYYGKYECETNILNVALYVSFFPTIISGPIIRYDGFKEFIIDKKKDRCNVADGLRRFFFGLGKKIIIANQLVFISNAAFADNAKLSVPFAWAGLIAFALRLYYDFSGCSDMAIGIGQMIGYTIPENFNEPYRSLSVSEFYRRWHITLGSWFKDYIYIPMGGNRTSKIRWIINIMTVWLFTGVWHGSTVNYIVWGLFLGIVIIIEKEFISRIKLPTFIRWLYTTGIILLSWLIFNTSSLYQFLHYGKRLIVGEQFDLNYIKTLDILYIWPIFLVSLLLMIPCVNKLIMRLKEKFPYLFDILSFAAFAVSLFLIISSSQATSVYFGF